MRVNLANDRGDGGVVVRGVRVEALVDQLVPCGYRGTSLISKRLPVGPYRRPMPRVLGGS